MNATLMRTPRWAFDLPGPGLTRDILLATAGSLGLAMLARIAIPLAFSPVPVTGQTFGVLLMGLVLGSRVGSLAVVFHLLEGAAGMPVFAGGTGGLAALTGPTGGYLLAFPAAAFLVGLLAERGGSRRGLARTTAAVLAGQAVIYAGGLGWLAVWMKALGTTPDPGLLVGIGVLPFLPGDAVKAFAAIAIRCGKKPRALQAFDVRG